MLVAILLGGPPGYLVVDVMPGPTASDSPNLQAGAVGTDVVVGRASVIDGDTLEIHGIRTRL